ncbi:MAG: HEAT repeat domain-containing protein, partial [Aeoliella sp.]
RMRQAAAKGLHTLEAPPGMAAPYLVAAANDPAVKEHVIDALASLGKDVVPHAIKALEQPDTRGLAIEVLGRLGPDAADAGSALLACLEQGDPAVCERVHFVLAEIGPAAAQATEKLAKALDAKATVVRRSALYALREIGPGAAAARPALMKMVQASGDSSADSKFEKQAAAWALASIAPDDSAVVEAIAPILVEGLKSNSALVRLESVTAALEISNATDRPIGKLIRKMAEEDTSPIVREAAEAALKSQN